MSLGLFVGCGDIELKKGIYETEDGLASVTLFEDNKFVFNRNIMTSYRPEGSYSIKKEKLILHVTDDEEYIFNIKDGQLIFVSGIEIEPGTIFKLKY